MYQVFANGELLYDTTVNTDYDMQISSPRLSMIFGEAGSFTFTFPVKHRLYGTSWRGHPFLCGKNDRVIVFKDGKWLWEGCPTDYEKNLFGDYSITCTGGLDYLKGVTMPLRVVAKQTRTTPKDSIIRSVIDGVLSYYNARIDELNARFNLGNSGILHKKIFTGHVSTVQNGRNLVNTFIAISNFETCFDVLKTNVIDPFGGYFYMTVGTDGYLRLNYSEQGLTGLNGTSRGIIKLGGNLLDYNISEDFNLCTSVIPLGDEYKEKGTDGARWWFKDNSPEYYDITQRATINGLNHGDGTTGTYGSRIYLGANSTENALLVKKYGFNEVVLDLKDVAAKYPGNAGSSVGGWEYYYAQYHVAEWRSLADYLGESGAWKVYETVPDDLNYKSDYQKALLIYGRDYLENQQFNKLILSLTASDIDCEDVYNEDLARSLGYWTNVSADLFGRNVKQYLVTEVDIPLDSPQNVNIILGGEETSLTKMIRYK